MAADKNTFRIVFKTQNLKTNFKPVTYFAITVCLTDVTPTVKILLEIWTKGLGRSYLRLVVDRYRHLKEMNNSA